jgi:hypothetical protein
VTRADSAIGRAAGRVERHIYMQPPAHGCVKEAA